MELSVRIATNWWLFHDYCNRKVALSIHHQSMMTTSHEQQFIRHVCNKPACCGNFSCLCWQGVLEILHHHWGSYLNNLKFHCTIGLVTCTTIEESTCHTSHTLHRKRNYLDILWLEQQNLESVRVTWMISRGHKWVKHIVEVMLAISGLPTQALVTLCNYTSPNKVLIHVNPYM